MKSLKPLIYSMSLASLVVALPACTSPEEQLQKHLQAADSFLEEGELDRARIEFRNALQIDDNSTDAWFGLAEVAESKAEWQKALNFATRATEIDPEHPDAQLLRAQILFAGGQMEDAQAISDQLQIIAPESADAVALRASLLRAQGDPDGAKTLATQALTLDPKHPVAPMILAVLALDEQAPEQALALLDESLSRREPTLTMLMLKVDVLTLLKRAGDAEQVLQQAVALQPDNVRLRYRLVDFYLRQFETDKAEVALRALVDANPEEPAHLDQLLRFLTQSTGPEAALAELEGRIERNPQDIELQFKRVALTQASGGSDTAESLLRGLADTAPDAESQHRAKAALAQRYFGAGDEEAGLALAEEILAEDAEHEVATLLRAGVLIDERKLTQAIADLRTVLRNNPESARAQVLLGRAHELDGALALAEDNYSRAAQVAPQSPYIQLQAYGFLRRRDQLERGVTLLETALENNPRSMELARELASVYLATGDYEKAETIADRIEEAGTQTELATALRNNLLLAQERYDTGIDALVAAYTAEPDNAQSLAALTGGYLRKGDIDAAQRTLEEALEKNPDNGPALLLRAQLLASQGNAEEASVLFERLLVLDPRQRTSYNVYSQFKTRSEGPRAGIAVLDRGLEVNPESFSLRVNKAGLLISVGDYEGAIALYETLIEDEPNADLVANNLASLLCEHRLDRASYERARDLALRFRESSRPEFQDTLGWAYYRLDQHDEALSLLQQAARALPNNASIVYHHARALQATGRLTRAREIYESLLESGVSDDIALNIKAALATLDGPVEPLKQGIDGL